MKPSRDRSMTRTRSPFWWEPDVTRLIASAKTDPAARDQLAELVYRPAFRRLDAWFSGAGLARLNVEVDAIFNELWEGDIATALGKVSFRNTASTGSTNV